MVRNDSQEPLREGCKNDYAPADRVEVAQEPKEIVPVGEDSGVPVPAPIDGVCVGISFKETRFLSAFDVSDSGPGAACPDTPLEQAVSSYTDLQVGRKTSLTVLIWKRNEQDVVVLKGRESRLRECLLRKIVDQRLCRRLELNGR